MNRRLRHARQRQPIRRDEPSGSPREDGSTDDLRRFRTILDRAGEAIFIIDSETRRFVDANETALQWLRLQRTWLLSLGVDDLDIEFPLEPPATSDAHLAETRDADRPWRSSAGVHRRRNGTSFPVDVEISRHSFGDRTLLLVVARESRERRRTEEELRQAEDKYQSLFDLSNDAIYLTSRDGVVVAANDAAKEIFSSSGGLVGLLARSFYRNPTDIEKFQLAVEEQGYARNHRVEFRRGDGTAFVGYLTAALRHAGDGSILGYQCVVRPAVGELRGPSGPEDDPRPTEPEHDPGSSSRAVPRREPAPSRTDSVGVRALERRTAALPVQQYPRHSDQSLRVRVWPAALVLGVVFSVPGWLGLVAEGFPYESGAGAWIWLCRCLACGILGIGILGRRRGGAVRAVAVSHLVVAAGLLVLGIRHISMLPFGLAEVVPAASAEIWTSILSVSAFTLLYVTSFTVLAVFLWRSSAGGRPRLLVL